MIAVGLDRPWLVADLPRPMRTLSWAPHRPGYAMASRIVWREIRNADLTEDLEVAPWFRAELQAAGQGDAVAMLTSRDIGTYRQASAEVAGIVADCVATAGLSNAESVGRRLPYHSADWGTINLAVAVAAPLSESAQLEALSVAVQARTAAVVAAGLMLATGPATGTGTDCVVMACDAGDLPFAGLHTAVGEAVGAAVLAAVTGAVDDWLRWRDEETARRAARE